MKKEEFMKIVRSKAKAELSEQEVAMFESIGEFQFLMVQLKGKYRRILRLEPLTGESSTC